MSVLQPPDLLFEEATHTYRVGGLVVPSVTQVIHAAGIMPWLDAVPPQTLKLACERGTRVHRVIEQINRGIDNSWADSEDFDWLRRRGCLGYVNGYFAWLDDTGFKVTRSSIEKRFHNQKWGYAGTIDFEAVGKDSRLWLVDLKSGGFDPAARLQTSAYLHRHTDDGPQEGARLVLELKQNGRYSARPLLARDDLGDWQGFRTCLSLWNWKKLHGIDCRRT